MRTDIGAAKELFDTADNRLGYLEKVRARLTGNERGAYLIEAVQERHGTVIAVLGFIGDRIDNLDTLRTTHQQMQNPRTALATLLQTAGGVAESVPVLGGTIGRFLDFYARAATAAGNAAVAIQDHVIEQSLLLFTRQVSPERHLYIEDEIPATVPSTERDRVLKMLQVRRAVALVAATTVEQARNASYRP